MSKWIQVGDRPLGEYAAYIRLSEVEQFEVQPKDGEWQVVVNRVRTDPSHPRYWIVTGFETFEEAEGYVLACVAD